MQKKIKGLLLTLLTLIVSPLLALSRCPICNYRIGADFTKCPKCLLNLDTDKSQIKPVKSTITVRNGYDAFIRHPQANNRAYKANKNAGGDKTGEIGVWGGPCTLRYLVDFNIESSMFDMGIDYTNFTPKKAYIFVSALPKKTEVEIPVVVYPLTRFLLLVQINLELGKENLMVVHGIMQLLLCHGYVRVAITKENV